MLDLERFTQACLEALYFTDTDDDEQPPADADMADETLLNLEADCRSFWRRFGCFVNNCSEPGPNYADKTPEQAGHDFWLTRNGHGAGFWGGDWPAPYAAMLTNGSKAYGEFQTYLGDDGLIYA